MDPTEDETIDFLSHDGFFKLTFLSLMSLNAWFEIENFFFPHRSLSNLRVIVDLQAP